MHCAPRSPESGARAHYGRFKDAIAEPFLVLYYIICFSRCRYRYESQFLAFDTDNTPNKHSYCTYQYVQWLNVCCVFDLLLIGYFRSSWQHHSITIYELLTTAAYFCLKCCVILANWHLPSAARRRIQTTSQQREKLPLQSKTQIIMFSSRRISWVFLLHRSSFLHSDRNTTVLFVFMREETRLTNAFESGDRCSWWSKEGGIRLNQRVC